MQRIRHSPRSAVVNVGCAAEGEGQGVGGRLATRRRGDGQDQLALPLTDAEVEEGAASGLGSNYLLQPSACPSVAAKSQGVSSVAGLVADQALGAKRAGD
jgi:hypothetical protein